MRHICGPGWERYLQLSEDSVVGSGCVAQVYRGVLTLPLRVEGKGRSGSGSDGRSSAALTTTTTMDVAVKILHPGVREAMEVDLNLMRTGAAAVEWVGQMLLTLFYVPYYTNNAASLAQNQSTATSTTSIATLATSTPTAAAITTYPLKCVSLSESVEEFASFMQSQLDLTHEAAALERIRSNFSSRFWKDRVIVPAPVYVDSGGTSGVDDDNSSLPVARLRSPTDAVKDEAVNSLPNEQHQQQLFPHPEVLIESFEEGVPMTRVLAGLTSAAAGGRAQQKQQPLLQQQRKEIAALGLSIILKMVSESIEVLIHSTR